jgi:hypothetical protein
MNDLRDQTFCDELDCNGTSLVSRSLFMTSPFSFTLSRRLTLHHRTAPFWGQFRQVLDIGPRNATVRPRNLVEIAMDRRRPVQATAPAVS